MYNGCMVLICYAFAVLLVDFISNNLPETELIQQIASWLPLLACPLYPTIPETLQLQHRAAWEDE